MCSKDVEIDQLKIALDEAKSKKEAVVLMNDHLNEIYKACGRGVTEDARSQMQAIEWKVDSLYNRLTTILSDTEFRRGLQKYSLRSNDKLEEDKIPPNNIYI